MSAILLSSTIKSWKARCLCGSPAFCLLLELFSQELYFDRQLQYIREIRLSERKFYQKITRSVCYSFDYDKDAKTTRLFFQTVQNKMHFAAHRHAAAELIAERADAQKTHMGLTTWGNAPDGKIIKADVTIAKNYPSEQEMSYLERIVTLYLDYAELQAERHIPMSMEDWAKRLDGFLEFNGNELLTGAGKISAEQAKFHAKTEFELITDVMQQMLPYLDNAQLKQLRQVMEHTLFHYDVSASVVKPEENGSCALQVSADIGNNGNR